MSNSRLDLVNKLDQFGHEDWKALAYQCGVATDCKPVDAVKALLRGELQLSIEVVRYLSELKTGTPLPALTKKFNPKEEFKKDGIWTSSNFENQLLAKAQIIASVPEMMVVYCNVNQTIKDAGIQARLPEGHIFDDVNLFLPYLAGLIDLQLGGAVGNLLSNEYANLFYVRVGSKDLVVLVRRYSSNSGWCCYAPRLGDDRWRAGSRVFSATIVA